MSHDQAPPGHDEQARGDYEQEHYRLEQGREESAARPPAPSALAIKTAKEATEIWPSLPNCAAELLASLLESAFAQVRAEERLRIVQAIVDGPWGDERFQIAAAIRKGGSK